MKKNTIYTIIVFIIIIAIIAFFIYEKYNKTTNNQETINAERLASEININTKKKQNDEIKNSEIQNSEIQKDEEYKRSHPTEVEISSYSSPLKAKASGRLTNIKISCSKLNGTLISKGETFSFNNIVGKPTADKGYQKADVFENGKTVKALGGGNCQVSSTIYNSALSANLEIVERHEHGKDVTYVPDGKDAAVSYGVMDLKFKNTTNDDIKLYVSSDDVNVSAKIVKLTY